MDASMASCQSRPHPIAIEHVLAVHTAMGRRHSSDEEGDRRDLDSKRDREERKGDHSDRDSKKKKKSKDKGRHRHRSRSKSGERRRSRSRDRKEERHKSSRYVPGSRIPSKNTPCAPYRGVNFSQPPHAPIPVT